MTEQAGIEEEEYAINVNFEGHAPEEITLQQIALGYTPTLLLTVNEDSEVPAVDFDIDAYGVEDLRGFLETVVAVLQTILERPLDRPEAGVPDAEEDVEQQP